MAELPSRLKLIHNYARTSIQSLIMLLSHDIQQPSNKENSVKADKPETIKHLFSPYLSFAEEQQLEVLSLEEDLKLDFPSSNEFYGNHFIEANVLKEASGHFEDTMQPS